VDVSKEVTVEAQTAVVFFITQLFEVRMQPSGKFSYK
jgi:hypothetical protein